MFIKEVDSQNLSPRCEFIWVVKCNSWSKLKKHLTFGADNCNSRISIAGSSDFADSRLLKPTVICIRIVYYTSHPVSQNYIRHATTLTLRLNHSHDYNDFRQCQNCVGVLQC